LIQVLLAWQPLLPKVAGPGPEEPVLTTEGQGVQGVVQQEMGRVLVAQPLPGKVLLAAAALTLQI
jgi:hypothetical protein